MLNTFNCVFLKIVTMCQNEQLSYGSRFLSCDNQSGQGPVTKQGYESRVNNVILLV